MNEKLKSVLEFLKLSEETVETENVVLLAEEKLENGTVIVAEEFKEGQPVFIKSVDSEESDDVALPVGEYTFENGDVLVVEVEGEILSITTPEAEPKEEEAPKEEEVVEAEEEVPAEEVVDGEPKENDMAQHEAKMLDLEERLAKLEEMLAPAADVVEEELTEEVKEEVKEEVQLSEEVNFSPETKNTSKGKLHFPKTSGFTTQDRVFAKLNKIK
tara:strand:+ start:159 stop:803 length:645 start_codon:yes stop_codon:yes gene_type:complete